MDSIQLYETIDFQHISDYIANRQAEHLTLDFKTINRADLSHNDDKRNFARALSGFANSDGGLIIWGVEANNKNPEKIDCAVGKKEISSLRLFLSKLNEFTGSFVSPLVDGVVHKEIETGGDTGFAVTLIPASNSGPHMAKAGEDRYYKRSGDSFYRMEHFDLEDMFGRRPQARLAIVERGDFPIANVPYHKGKWRIAFDVVNNGRGTAKLICLEFPYTLGMSYDRSMFGWTSSFSNFEQQTNTGTVLFQLPANEVLHPNMKRQFDSLCVVGPHFQQGQTVRLSCTLYCDGSALVQQEVVGTLQPIPLER